MVKKYEKDRSHMSAEIERSVKTRAGHSCQVSNCTEHTYLEIHHIDQNRENNVIDNLILLCDKHHKMAHKDIIDRKSLKIYITKPAPAPAPHPLDIKAYNLIKSSFIKDNYINHLKNEDFISPMSYWFIDQIHILIHIWDDTLSDFNDIKLNELNYQLKNACFAFSRMQAQKIYPGKGGREYYELPKENRTEEFFYAEAQALKSAADNVCNTFNDLIRACISIGIDN